MNNKQKRVLLVSQNFLPENFKSNDIAFELQKKGFIVDVLTGIPNYPRGEYYDGYGVFSKRSEIIDGVHIYRCLQTPRGKRATGLGLFLNYFSFAFFSTFWAFYFVLFKKKYDAIIVHEVSPITQAWPAVIIGVLRKTSVYTWVLDVWPEALMSGANINNKLLLETVGVFVKFVYKYTSKILISSERFKELIINRVDDDRKIVYFPNWCDDILQMPKVAVPNVQFRDDCFNIMLAGNIGGAQDVISLLKAAEILKNNKRIHWIFVGGGSERQNMLNYIKEHNLEGVVSCIDSLPFKYMSEVYSHATVMIVSLLSNFAVLDAVVPARLQSYMSSMKPIIGMANGGCADIIKESKCGVVVPASDYQQLAEQIQVMSRMPKETLDIFGQNGRQFYLNNFQKEQCINNLISLI